MTGREVGAAEGTTLAARLTESDQWERVDDETQEKPRRRVRKKADDES